MSECEKSSECSCMREGKEEKKDWTILPGYPVKINMEPMAHSMSLRDWFAGMALQGFIGDTGSKFLIEAATTNKEDIKQSATGYAMMSYVFADAMIANRNK